MCVWVFVCVCVRVCECRCVFVCVHTYIITYVIIPQRHMEKGHPCCAVRIKLAVFVRCCTALVEEVEGLSEPHEHDAVNYGEGEHVP